MSRTKQGIIILVIAVTVLSWLMFCPLAKADPPHPSQMYKWEAWPNGTVVLYFMENGYKSQYVYQMAHEVEPANACTHKFNKDTFKLITFNSTYPYFYTMNAEPIGVWDVKKKEYVRLDK